MARTWTCSQVSHLKRSSPLWRARGQRAAMPIWGSDDRASKALTGLICTSLVQYMFDRRW
jgi:hypothetical protein